MTSLSILAFTLAFLATFVAGNGDIVTSFFRMVQSKKMPPDVCQEVSGSRSPTKLYCANTCDVTATCQSFSFTCSDTDPRPVCRCFLCFTADLGAATTVPHATTGVRVTKTSPPVTADSIPTSTHHFVSSTASTENPTTLPQQDVTTSLSFSISTTTTEISSENPAESPSTASAVLLPVCSPPPLLPRTMVTHAVTSSNDVAHYTCSVSTDVYVRGTTDVTCTNADDWPTATILCAPTTCWYRHWVYGPVYRGTIARTPRGYDCQPWALNTPQKKNPTYDEPSMYPSDNDDMVAASNFCRIFDDGDDYVWCYENRPMGLFGTLRYFQDCGVNRCQDVPGQRSP